MSSSQRIIQLKFDREGIPGSQQHYFHFMWGYLMPSLGRILEDTRSDVIFRFESCGPVMDIKIKELCEWLEIPFQIDLSGGADKESAEVESMLVPRWDCWIRSRIRVWMSTRLHRMGLRFRVLEGMDRVILHLLAAAGCSQDLVESRGADPAPDQMDSRPWLLLKRSDEPAFYGPDGSADKSHYGVGRRAIANLAELTDDLRHGGLPVQTYEPGRDTLVQQIRTFHRADGVIAIRGAEFANVAWMRRGSAAVMLATPKKRPNHYASGLAGARGVRFKLISVASNYPEVSAATVRRNLQSMGFGEPRL